jgi:hypothetical protein
VTTPGLVSDALTSVAEKRRCRASQRRAAQCSIEPSVTGGHPSTPPRFGSCSFRRTAGTREWRGGQRSSTACQWAPPVSGCSPPDIPDTPRLLVRPSTPALFRAARFGRPTPAAARPGSTRFVPRAPHRTPVTARPPYPKPESIGPYQPPAASTAAKDGQLIVRFTGVPAASLPFSSNFPPEP